MPVTFITYKKTVSSGPILSALTITDQDDNTITITPTFNPGTLKGYSGSGLAGTSALKIIATFASGTCTASTDMGEQVSLTSGKASPPLGIIAAQDNNITISHSSDGDYLFVITIPPPPPVSKQYEIYVDGTSSLSRMPFYGLYDYSQTGAIILADDLMMVGLEMGATITAFEYQFSGWTTGYTVNNQSIKMGHTFAPFFPDPAEPSYVDIGVQDLKEVKSSFTWTCPKSEDWEKFDLDTSFEWDGMSNLLISWENRDGSWDSGYGSLKGKYGGNRGHAWFADNSYPSKSSGWDNGRPNLKLWA